MSSKQAALPRRDPVPLHKAALWFWTAFWFGVLAGIAAISSPSSAAIGAVIAIPAAAAGAWRYVRARRDPAAAVHRELLATLRALQGSGPWLDRDERVAYTYEVKGRRIPLMRAVTVIRIPEDDVLAQQREGSAHLVVDAWTVNTWEYGIRHSLHGTTVTEADIDSGVIRFPRTGFWQWRKGQRAARKAGMLYAPAGEVRTLVRALQGSEPIAPDGAS